MSTHTTEDIEAGHIDGLCSQRDRCREIGRAIATIDMRTAPTYEEKYASTEYKTLCAELEQIMLDDTNHDRAEFIVRNHAYWQGYDETKWPTP